MERMRRRLSDCPSLQATEEVLGKAAKVTLGKENTVIVGDGSSQDAVEARVRQIKNVIANTEQDYEREKLNERVARCVSSSQPHSFT